MSRATGLDKADALALSILDLIMFTMSCSVLNSWTSEPRPRLPTVVGAWPYPEFFSWPRPRFVRVLEKRSKGHIILVIEVPMLFSSQIPIKVQMQVQCSYKFKFKYKYNYCTNTTRNTHTSSDTDTHYNYNHKYKESAARGDLHNPR